MDLEERLLQQVVRVDAIAREGGQIREQRRGKRRIEAFERLQGACLIRGH
jgi:hypothetical protein